MIITLLHEPTGKILTIVAERGKAPKKYYIDENGNEWPKFQCTPQRIKGDPEYRRRMSHGAKLKPKTNEE